MIWKAPRPASKSSSRNKAIDRPAPCPPWAGRGLFWLGHLMLTSLRATKLLVGVLWLSLLGCTAAFAHAEFRDSEPAANSIVVSMPQTVMLHFSEDVGVLILEWLLPDGTQSPAEADVVSDRILVSPPPPKGGGSYTLKWRVASADGHPVGGALVFSLFHASGEYVDAKADRIAYLALALRAVMVLALTLSVGAGVYRTMVGPIPALANSRLQKTAWIVPVAGIALIGVEGADRIGTFSALLSPQGWSAALSSPIAQSVALAIVSAVLSATRSDRFSALSAWVIASISFAVTGHARAEVWPLMPLTFLHAAAILFWIGGLFPLAASVLMSNGAARAVPLKSFSKPALPMVLVILATGGALILHRSNAPGLLQSPWALLIAVKLVLVTAMLALALLHRFKTTPALEKGNDPAIGHSLGAEIALGVLVLVVATGFRLAPPPASKVPPLPMTHLQQGALTVMLTPSGRPPGLIVFNLHVIDTLHPDFVPKDVSLALSDPNAGVGPIKAIARLNAGQWETEGITLPTAGPWQAVITVLVSDFASVKLEADIKMLQ